mmetsp:Transcript_7038/g.13059  ORF Transcript_7038/g.13059 Transcript_7038/m.13059 type:complete len:87 (-) Transcript_7038:10-270(-)
MRSSSSSEGGTSPSTRPAKSPAVSLLHAAAFFFLGTRCLAVVFIFAVLENTQPGSLSSWTDHNLYQLATPMPRWWLRGRRATDFGT